MAGVRSSVHSAARNTGTAGMYKLTDFLTIKDFPLFPPICSVKCGIWCIPGSLPPVIRILTAAVGASAALTHTHTRKYTVTHTHAHTNEKINKQAPFPPTSHNETGEERKKERRSDIDR